MQDSVTMLLAATAAIAEHGDEPHIVVADLCRRFGVDEDAALAMATAAQLIARAPRSSRGDDLVRDDVVVRPCPICGRSNALVTMGRDHDFRGQVRREWVIDIDCSNDCCPTGARGERTAADA